MTTTTNTTTNTTVTTSTATTVGRRIHLIDIENLCGLARPSLHDLELVRARYANLVEPGPEDHIVLACNHRAALDVGCTWKGCRLLVRSGANGADLALLDVLHDENVEARFDGVVIASGDGIFTEAAMVLNHSGLTVQIVSRARALSARLRMVAQSVSFLGGSDPVLAA